MAGLPASGTQTQQSLKLLVKGFAGFDMRLLTGVVKLSAHRSPSLELVSDPVFPPFRAVLKSRSYAAMANFWIGVIPPSAMLGRS